MTTVITAKAVSELRQRTGAGMMDCKKALEENGGDMDASVEYLRKKGIAKAEKRADRHRSPKRRHEGEHRLTLFYGEKEVQEGVVEELHNCTQMIEKGEEQILTFRIDKPSIASEKPYKFYVPGVEDQSIEVVIP